MKRLIIDILFFVLIPLMPWWLTLVIMLIFCFYFEFYFEAVIGGLMVDSLYGVDTSYFRNSSLVMTYLSSAIFLASTIVKQRLRLIRNG